MTGEIHDRCPTPGCEGTVVFVPLITSIGSAGTCDGCGATFRLLGGEARLVEAPKFDG